MTTHVHASRLPTSDNREGGSVGICDVVLSAAERWIDDEGTYVVQSIEFDLFGQGDDWPSALSDFVAHARDLVAYLTELVAEGGATEHETEVSAELSKRLLTGIQQAYEKLLEAEEARRVVQLSLRRRHLRQRANTWLPPTPTNSTQLSHA